MNKPNFFIVGTAKSGTTSLYHSLNQHPNIFMCPIKEPNYFCTDITKLRLNDPLVPKRGFDIKKYISGSMEKYYHRAFVTEWDDYIALFKNVKNENAIGEASVNYLISTVASNNIYKTIPDAKIIIIIRNPVDLIVSHYLARVKLGQTHKSFKQEISHIAKISSNKLDYANSLLAQGLYFNQVKRYFNEFPNENIKIIVYDDYKNNPKKIITEILIFLKVKANIELNSKKTHNVSTGIKFRKTIYLINLLRIKHKLWKILPNSIQSKIKYFLNKPIDFKINSDDKTYLINYFKDDIENTSNLINTDLNHWILQ